SRCGEPECPSAARAPRHTVEVCGAEPGHVARPPPPVAALRRCAAGVRVRAPSPVRSATRHTGRTVMQVSTYVGALVPAGAAVLGPASAASATVTTHNSTDVGLFGASDPTYDGAFRQSLGILAEQVAGVHDTAAITWLVNQQCPDGGWTAHRSDLSKPCPATDLNAFTGEDSNSTALAVQALHRLGVTPKHDAIAFLHALQDSDGGFPLIAGSGTDPHSTALVVQAILAAGQHPTSASWTAGGHTPIDALMASWVNCTGTPSSDTDAGAFSSPYSSGHGDLVASLQ